MKLLHRRRDVKTWKLLPNSCELSNQGCYQMQKIRESILQLKISHNSKYTRVSIRTSISSANALYRWKRFNWTITARRKNEESNINFETCKNGISSALRQSAQTEFRKGIVCEKDEVPGLLKRKSCSYWSIEFLRFHSPEKLQFVLDEAHDGLMERLLRHTKASR